MFKYKLTDNFLLSEFFKTNQGLFYECEQVANMCCVLRNIISNGTEFRITRNIKKLANFMQLFRDSFNQPIFITSGFRSAELNKKVGGVVDSKHRIGLACDFYFSGYDRYRHPHKVFGTPSKVMTMCQWLIDAKNSGKLSELIFHDDYIHLAINE